MEVFGRGGWPGRIGFRQAASGKGGEVEIKPVSTDYEDRSLNIDGSGRLAIEARDNSYGKRCRCCGPDRRGLGTAGGAADDGGLASRDGLRWQGRRLLSDGQGNGKSG